MKQSRHFFLLIFLLIFSLSLSACSRFNQPATPTPTIFIAAVGETATPIPSPTPDPAAIVRLGVEQKSDLGSYSFQNIDAWNETGEPLKLSGENGVYSMISQDGSLYLNLSSKEAGANHSSNDCQKMILERMDGSINGFQHTAASAANVTNIPGSVSDFSGQLGAENMVGKLAVFFPAGRCFSLIGMAKGSDAAAIWEKSGQYAFDKVLNSIHFLDQLASPGCQISGDPGYGLSPDTPIRIGKTSPTDGLSREEIYLKTLRGPAGQAVAFTRKAPIYNTRHEIVDIYEISYEGIPNPLNVYFDIESYAPPLALQGFSCEGAFPIEEP